jgi:uncharacterized membrane protein
MDKLIAAMFAILGIMVVFTLISLIMIKIGWALFMVPVFHLADLSWLEAFGFALLASAFRGTGSVSKKD